MNQDFLPYGRHVIDDDDVAAVVSVLKGDWLTTGPSVTAFERALAERVNAPYAACCANGTAALHLSMLALQVGPGDCVIVPAMTFLATANAVRFVGADVVFADVDPDTGLLTPETFQRALDRAHGPIKAVIPVHLNGHSVDMKSIAAIADRRNVAIVEDACHAIGGTQTTSEGPLAPVGSCASSKMAIFSFHPVKSIAMGEGGAITTRDGDLAERVVRLRAHGMIKDKSRFALKNAAFDDNGDANPWYYEMPEIGFNYRVSDINCALGLSQLRKLDRNLAARERLAGFYDAGLLKLDNLLHPVPRPREGASGWHLYVVLIDFDAAGVARSAVMRQLHERGIGSQVHYFPVCHQPYYRQLYGSTAVPGADEYYRRALTLPLYPTMTQEDVARVIDALDQILRH
jgi:UDP-4-amino-4,6-dideoxy-N-acetyl-beta-L-altrosamine transaminase